MKSMNNIRSKLIKEGIEHKENKLPTVIERKFHWEECQKCDGLGEIWSNDDYETDDPAPCLYCHNGHVKVYKLAYE